MAIVTIPNSLREKLGSDGTEDLIGLFNKVEESVKKDNISFVEEKFERRLSEEIGKVRIELSEMDTRFEKEIGKVRVEIAETKAYLEVKIAQNQAFLLRWMFIFWVGQIGALTAILFAFFK